MKIILSPSKTQDFTKSSPIAYYEPQYIKPAQDLVKKMQTFDQNQLASIMKISGTKLEEAYNNYQNFAINVSAPAIYTYTGLVYKYLDTSNYTENMLNYLDEHLIILSALYGILKPFDGIKPYRLDMKMSIMDQTLYQYWSKVMEEYFKDEQIIDLASNEFSKMIKGNKVTIGFREFNDGKYTNQATYAKMARGMLLNLMIKNQITDLETIKSLEFEGYHYNKSISKDTLLLFSRKNKSSHP